ncbi:hypothetical protein BKA61DRAFT_707217 [Leptodontidium sp. MPI-SDFR-AT-0119]|nr:hypothetical protein BKA61DRAFT_707217 [Leptodontidium sp. MPI-SDFR-AT-0119]
MPFDAELCVVVATNRGFSGVIFSQHQQRPIAPPFRRSISFGIFNRFSSESHLLSSSYLAHFTRARITISHRKISVTFSHHLTTRMGARARHIASKPTPCQTSKEDIPLIREMIAKAVVPANVDIATQEIIQMAEDAGSGDRGAEEKVMELVVNPNGKAHFDLGYTIVCNRSQGDLGISNQGRNAREAMFFDSKPWSAISKECAGVKALKDRLDKLLVDVTRQNFQAVAVDVQTRIDELAEELDGLGPARQTPIDQRNHLIRVAADFRDIATKAVDAVNYIMRCEIGEQQPGGPF